MNRSWTGEMKMSRAALEMVPTEWLHGSGPAHTGLLIRECVANGS
jgi:hypothetical protein